MSGKSAVCPETMLGKSADRLELVFAGRWESTVEKPAIGLEMMLGKSADGLEELRAAGSVELALDKLADASGLLSSSVVS